MARGFDRRPDRFDEPSPREGPGMAAQDPDITVTVVSWNTRRLLDSCLRSLRDGSHRVRMEVHVVDNASTDGSPEMVRSGYPEVRLQENETNLGFASANNQSWRLARGRYWLLLNSDTEVRAGAIDTLVEFMDAHPRAGLATARLVNPDGTPQFCAQPTPSIALGLLESSRLHKLMPEALRGRLLLGTYWTYDAPIQVGWTWGTALIARREAVEQAGPLPEDFFFYGEDVEWCLRLRRFGWEVWFCPEAEVLHLGAQSAKNQWDEAARAARVQGGYYHAVERHRGRFYVRSLQASTLAALGTNWLADRVRGRDVSPGLSASLAFHVRCLKGVG